jgi:hypothetical protein
MLAACGVFAAAHPLVSQVPVPAIRLVAAEPVKMSALAGEVKDSLGTPIPYATVFIPGGSATTTANDSGRFMLANIPPGSARFSIRRLGFAQLNFALEMPEDTTLIVAIRMHRTVARLRDVTIEETMTSVALNRLGVYERQRLGVGTFLLPADIKERAPSRVEELLYGIPGVTVFNTNGRLVAYGKSKGAYCRLSVFVDGKRFPFRGKDELPIPVNDLRAVEVYPRATEPPAQFHDPDNALCGSIVFWTKVD